MGSQAERGPLATHWRDKVKGGTDTGVGHLRGPKDSGKTGRNLKGGGETEMLGQGPWPGVHGEWQPGTAQGRGGACGILGLQGVGVGQGHGGYAALAL